jgi:hypothetical protein
MTPPSVLPLLAPFFQGQAYQPLSAPWLGALNDLVKVSNQAGSTPVSYLDASLHDNLVLMDLAGAGVRAVGLGAATGAVTIAAPTGGSPGQQFSVRIDQGAAPRAVDFDAAWKGLGSGDQRITAPATPNTYSVFYFEIGLDGYPYLSAPPWLGGSL